MQHIQQPAASPSTPGAHATQHEGLIIFRPAHRVVKTENITQVRANFVDLDGAALEPLRDANPRPHIIIETSPGRYAGYWFVEDEPLDQFTNIQKRLAMTFNSDPSVHDLPRVMRLPGFYHNKSGPFLSRIIAHHNAPKYRPADLEPLLGQLAQPKTYE